MKKISLLFTFILLIGILSACGSKDEETGKALNDKKIVVGVTAGPHELVVNKVKELAAKDGLEIDVKVFTEYILPNTALSEGDLDINSFQTLPFLDKVNFDRELNLVPVGKTILLPMGIYSDKFDSLDDIPDGATFGMPNDPSNGARALIVLEAAGVITLRDEDKTTGTVQDIVENPKNLKFVELEASQLPKQLIELDFAAINTNFILAAGKNPVEDSIYLESKSSPYVNYIVVREENKDDAVVKKFVELYQTEEVRDFIETEFDGTILSSWD